MTLFTAPILTRIEYCRAITSPFTGGRMAELMNMQKSLTARVDLVKKKRERKKERLKAMALLAGPDTEEIHIHYNKQRENNFSNKPKKQLFVV